MYSCSVKEPASIIDTLNNKSINVVDLSNTKNGHKNGASISVKINIQDNKFNTKSSDGLNSSNTLSYRVNLCTDNKMPFTSRVLQGNRDGVILSRTGSSSMTFSNIGSGTYYATVTVFNIPKDSVTISPALISEGMVAPNNGNIGSPYNSTDAGARVAVSSNKVIVDSELALTFDPPVSNTLDISANIEAKGVINDSFVQITNNSVTGSFNAKGLSK